MKKGLLLFCASMLLAGSGVFAQKYSHWSLDLKGGLDRGVWGNELKGGYYGYELGGEIEYTINPLFGIALDYAYLDYGREGLEGADDVTGTTHEGALLGSVNVLNLVSKYRQGGWKKFNIYTRAGLGLSFYNTELRGDRTTIVLPLSAVFEYNVGRVLALGLSGESRWHTSGDMGLGYMGTPNSTIWSALANVRIKFAGKNPHMRNITVPEFEAPLAQSLVEKYDDSELRQATNDNAAAIAALQNQLGQTNSEVSRINQDLNNAKEEIIKCCAKPEPLPTMAAYPSLGNIQFAVNSQVIAAHYQRELDALAVQLKQQTDLKVTVTGYTDSSGSVKTNEALSLKRAETVSNYLISKGVNAAQIVTRGMGPANPIASNATADGRIKNRRVEVLFSR